MLVIGAPAPRLDIFTFGRELLRTGDLDPVYILLWEAQFDRHFLLRWLLAYFCFYHVGTASWIAHRYQPGLFCFDAAYWEAMERAAGSKDYPRGSERRHFRGRNAARSVAWLCKQGVDALFEPFFASLSPTAAGVMDYVRSWEGFGPWISFKVADMMERLDLCWVDFSDGADIFLFESPLEGARLLWDTEGQPHAGFGDGVGPWAVGRILAELGKGGLTLLESRRTGDRGIRGLRSLRTGDRGSTGLVGVGQVLPRQPLQGLPLAPPRYERPIGPQECETILCKHKSYLGGHYHVGKDIHECRSALASFGRCPTSQRLYTAGKRGGLW